MYAKVDQHSLLDKAVIESTTKFLEELGLEYPDTTGLQDFWDEMENITFYLCKENQK
jgi:hypothetical protein